MTTTLLYLVISIVVAQEPDPRLRASPPLSKAEQLAYIATAAPPVVVQSATIYLQDARGEYYVETRGTNGYSCIIQRGTNGQSVIPRCDDAAGAAALFPTYELLERMRANRQPVQAYRDSLADGYRTGRFQAPRFGSFSYMYSVSGYFMTDAGKRIPFTPHVMVNWPGCEPSDLGVPGTAAFREVHLSLLDVRSPQCHLIIDTPPETGIALRK